MTERTTFGKALPKPIPPKLHDIRGRETDALDADMHGQVLLRQYCSDPAFLAYMKELVKNDGENHLGIGWEFLGFIEDYYHIRQYLLGRHYASELVIVDVGCCAGLQQVLFRDFAGYIGIDLAFEPRSFSENVSFIKGEFSELVDFGQFVPHDKMVGIANMSLLYGGSEHAQELFNKCFKRKIII